MALVVPNQGEEIALAAFLNKTAPQDLTLRLYTNDYTPVEGTTEANVTEASGSGYAAKALTAANWTIAGDPREASYPEQTFAFTGALGNVYGYYLTQNTSGKLIYAERFTGAPFNVAQNGDEIKVTPKITAD